MGWTSRRLPGDATRHREQSEATQTKGLQLRLSLDCFALLK
jgi:hypothetical protein